MNYYIQSIMLTVLLGCGESKGRESSAGPVEADSEPSRKLTSEEMLEATGGGYVSPHGMLRECLGRLVFDVAEPIQWPTFLGKDSPNIFTSLFSNDLYARNDAMMVQGVRIAVVGPNTDSTRDRIRAGTPWAKIERHDGYIKIRSRYLDRLRNQKIASVSVQEEIEEGKAAILEWEKVKSETQARYEPVHLPLADSESYWTSRAGTGDGLSIHSIYRAYLTRGDFIFVFESVLELAGGMSSRFISSNFMNSSTSFARAPPTRFPPIWVFVYHMVSLQTMGG